MTVHAAMTQAWAAAAQAEATGRQAAVAADSGTPGIPRDKVIVDWMSGEEYEAYIQSSNMDDWSGKELYGITLSFNSGAEAIHLPVLPPSFEAGDGGDGSSYDTGSGGLINVIKNPKLTEYKFSSVFPARWYPFVISQSLYKPMVYIEMIRGWMKSRRPCRLIYVARDYTLNEAVSIESFNWKEVAGSPGDIEYELSLKTYVFYGARLAAVSNAKQQAPKRADDKTKPKTYKLVAGDTLWAIGKKFNVDWHAIQMLNAIKDADIRRLPIGMEIKLP